MKKKKRKGKLQEKGGEEEHAFVIAFYVRKKMGYFQLDKKIIRLIKIQMSPC